jgi:glutamyl-tRNA synthetase
MILGPDGKRLSKRHGATAIGEYQQQGILPDAMVNFLALLGWSPGTDEEIFARDELIERFELDGINRKSAIFDTQKLEWMNGRYLAEHPSADLARLLRDAAAGERDGPAGGVVAAAGRPAEGARPHRAEMADQARPYVMTTVVATIAMPPSRSTGRIPATVRGRLERCQPVRVLETLRRGAARGRGARSRRGARALGQGKLIHPLRVALTGPAASPGIFEVARLLGREQVLATAGISARARLRQPPEMPRTVA